MANEKRCDWSTPVEEGTGTLTVRCEARGAGKNGGKDWSHVKVVTSRETGGSGGVQTVQVMDVCPEHAKVLADHLAAVPVRK
jgi:hypothetical protein